MNIKIDENQMPITIKIYSTENEKERKLADKAIDLFSVIWDLKESFLWRAAVKGEHNYKSADEVLNAVLDYLMQEIENKGLGEFFE